MYSIQDDNPIIPQPLLIFAIKNIGLDIYFNFLFWLECFIKVLAPGIAIFLTFSWSFTVYPNFFLEIARKITRDDDNVGILWENLLPQYLLAAFTFGDFLGRFVSASRLAARAKRHQLLLIVIGRFCISLVVFVLFFVRQGGTLFFGLFIWLFACIHGNFLFFSIFFNLIKSFC